VAELTECGATPGVPRPLRRALLAFTVGAVFGAAPLGWAGAGNRGRFNSGLLWRVERDGTPDSYVFGTMHVADPRVAEPSTTVLTALSRSRTLAMEVVVDSGVDPNVFDQERLADDQSLEALIGGEAYAQTRHVLGERGLSEQAIARMKPWAAMMAVAAAGPRDAPLALDSRLLAAARQARLHVRALEMVEEQIASFDAIPIESQVALLKHALAHRPELEAENEIMIRAWLKGDLLTMVHFPSRMDSVNPGVVRHYDELVRHLVYNRTALMHHRLMPMLKSGRVFVAVGALHLQGEKGLLALIEAGGYRAAPID
jgi:uncharacterized protein YbaP (TraB family)